MLSTVHKHKNPRYYNHLVLLILVIVVDSSPFGWPATTELTRTLALQLFESLCNQQLQASLISALDFEGAKTTKIARRGLGGKLVHGGLGQLYIWKVKGKTRLFVFVESLAENNLDIVFSCDRFSLGMGLRREWNAPRLRRYSSVSVLGAWKMVSCLGIRIDS